MRYVTVDQVLQINRAVIKDQDLEVYPNHGLLDSAVMRPQQSAFGEDAYTDIHAKAGALLHSLARNHAFLDGNKRTALLATDAFYALNGWRLELEQSVAVSLTVDAAQGYIDAAGVAAVLKNYATQHVWPDDD